MYNDSEGYQKKNKSQSLRNTRLYGWLRFSRSQYHSVTCSTMIIAALFVTTRNWKQSRCSSVEEWIPKMWFIYTIEHYSAIKKYIMNFADKWIEQDNILSEVTQTQKFMNGMYSMISGYYPKSIEQPYYTPQTLRR